MNLIDFGFILLQLKIIGNVGMFSETTWLSDDFVLQNICWEVALLKKHEKT